MPGFGAKANHGLQNSRAGGVHRPKPVATMLVMTRHTYRFCAGSLSGPAW